MSWASPPSALVKFEGMLLLLSNVQKPYCAPEILEQALADFPEVRQRQVVREHKAVSCRLTSTHRKTPGEKERVRMLSLHVQVGG